ncbi:MAG TPA: hypothetical protein VGF92_04950 [Stellaceae bacterium]|jgi:hypothetical protein
MAMANPTSLHAADAPQHPPAACAPAPANVGNSPIEVPEPQPGQHIELTVTPNQALVFDFNPLDAEAVRHGDDLTLTFADGGVLVLHHIAQNGNPLPTALQLPDGTIINPCELLQALPDEQPSPTAGKIPEEKIPQPNPAAGPVVGAPPVTTPFEAPGLGHGLTPLGPLSPEGFTITTHFPPPGNGGFPPSPPSSPPTTPPNTPPHTPSTPFLAMIEDSHLLQYPATATTGDLMTDSYFGHAIVTSNPAAHVDSYVFWQPGSVAVDPAADPAGAAAGMWGSLNMLSDGSYTYALNATGVAAASQLGSDILSQELGSPGSPDTPYPLLDLFTATVDNGFQTASQQLAIYTVADNVAPSQTTASISGSAAGAQVLLTYTDLADPAHSFQETLTIGSNGLITAEGAPIQPHDAALVTLEYQGTPTTITGFSVAGETFTGLNIPLDGTDHALTAIINPDLSGFGDPGDTGSVIVAPAGYANVAGSFSAAVAGQYVYETAGNPDNTLSVVSGSDADQSGTVLNLGTNTGHAIGGLGSDVFVDNGVGGTTYNGGAGIVITGTPTEVGTLSLFVDNASLAGGFEQVTVNVTTGESDTAMATALANAVNADANLNALGLTASAVAAGGDSFQLLQGAGSPSFDSLTSFEELALSTSGNPPAMSITGQAGIDTLRLDTGGNNIVNPASLNQFANIDVFDLTASAAGSGASNSITLNASDVLQLTANENPAIKTFTGANAMWVEGTGNDIVNLQGFTQISDPITNSSQAPAVATAPTGLQTSASQMVGFAEYAGTVNGQTVHVYVENAIVNAGHVHLH